jgi:hypothetical protein
VPDSTRPTLEELTMVLSHLADRVSADRDPMLDPIIGSSLRRILDELRLHVPGLEPAPDIQAARILAHSASAALQHGREREALARALRGLSFAPHHPELHYLAASACLELGAPQEGVALLIHALWVHPGYTDARRDLDTLAFLRQRGDGEGWELVDGTSFDSRDDDGLWFDEDTGEGKRAA